MALTQVKAEGIATGAVTTSKLEDDAVSNAKLTSSTNQANRAVGADTVQDDAIGVAALSATGTASNTTFLRGDNSWQTNSTTTEGTAVLSTGESGGTKFLREDGDGTSSWQSVSATDSTKMPLAGGTFTNDVTFEGNTSGRDMLWDKSRDSLVFKDNAYIELGTGTDLQIYHNGTDNYIKNVSGALKILMGSEYAIQAVANGAVELYYNDIKTFNTTGSGIVVQGPESGDGILYMYADEGDEDADKWRNIALASGSTFQIQNLNSGSWETNIECNGDGNVELYNNGVKKFETTSTGAEVTGRLDVNVASATGEPGINFTNSDTGTGTSNGFGLGINDAESPYIWNRENTDLRIATNNAERVRIAAGGSHLLLGGTASVNEITEGSTHCGLVIGNTSMGNGGISIVNSTTGAGRIYFGDNTGSDAGRNRGQLSYYHDGDFMYFATAGTESMRIESGGDVSITDGNLKVADGHGIDFSATSDGAGTDTSELLDDYEEGTWTPTLQCSATNPSYGGSAAGVYTKVGRQVTCSGYIDTNPVNSNGDGSLYIFGLPYGAANISGNNIPGHASITTYGPHWGGDSYQICASVDESQARMNLKHFQNNGAMSHWTWSESGWASGDAIYFTVTYQT